MFFLQRDPGWLPKYGIPPKMTAVFQQHFISLHDMVSPFSLTLFGLTLVSGKRPERRKICWVSVLGNPWTHWRLEMSRKGRQ